MILRRIIPILLCLFSVTMRAQKPVVEIGPEIKIDKDMYFWGHLHSDATGHYVMLMESSGGMTVMGIGGGNRTLKPIVQKYDRKYSLVFSKEFLVDDKDVDFGNMLYASNKFFFCTEQRDKKAKKFTCSIIPVDYNGKAGKVEKVATIQYTEKDDAPSEVIWQMSEDTSKLLVATIADDNNDDLKTKVSINVYDNQLSKQWAKGFTLPYTQEQVTPKNWTITNDGRVYLLAKVYDGSRKKESKKSGDERKPAYQMVLFLFDGTSDKPKESILSFEKKFVTDVTFKLNHDNDLSCVGFYANDTKGVIKGVFFVRIDGKTGAVVNASQKEIPAADLENLDTEKDRSGEKGLDSDYTFGKLILRDDGGVLVTAEKQYITVHTSSSGTSMRTYTIYHNDELFVTSVSPDGKIEWLKVVPKKQQGGTRMFNGYSTMVSGSNVYILYNDDEDNIKLPLNHKAKGLSSFKDAAAALVTISSEGKASRRQIFDSKADADALMVPGDGEQISPNELLFVTTRFKILGKTSLRMGLVRI